MSSGDVNNLRGAGYSGGLSDMRQQFETDNGARNLQELLIGRGYSGGLNDMIQAQALSQGMTVSEYNRVFGTWFSHIGAGSPLSILNFTDTQYFEFVEPVQLAGDFEIEVFSTNGNTAGANVLTGGKEGFAFFTQQTSGDLNVSLSRSDIAQDNVFLGGNGDILQEAKLNRCFCRRVGNEFTFGTQDGDVTRTQPADTDDTIVIDWVGAANITQGDDTPFFMPDQMSFKRVRIWDGGDKNTGTLIVDLPLSDSVNAHQINAAQPNIEISDQSSLPFTSTGGDLTETIPLSEPLETGRLYQLDYRSSGGRVIIRQGGTDVVVDLNPDESSQPAFGTIFFEATGTHNSLEIETFSAGRTVNKVELSKLFGVQDMGINPSDWEPIEYNVDEMVFRGTTELISDGTFTEGVSDWIFNPSNTGATIAHENQAGRFTTTAASTVDFFQVAGLVVGTEYEIQLDVLEATGTFRNVAGFAGQGAAMTAPNSYTERLIARGNGSAGIRLDPSSNVLVDNFSYKRYIEYADGALEDDSMPPPQLFSALFENDVGLATQVVNFAGSGDVGVISDLTTTSATLRQTVGGQELAGGVRSTIVAEDPVYFEYDVELDAGVAEADAQVAFIPNIQGDTYIESFQGPVTVEAGELVGVSGVGMQNIEFRNPPGFSFFGFASGETPATAGATRIGIAYTPATGTYVIHAWTTNLATFQYPTILDVATVVEFGPYSISPLETANHFSMTIFLALLPIIGAGLGFTVRLLTNQADFNRPGGIPAGFQDLESVTGGDTAASTQPLGTIP